MRYNLEQPKIEKNAETTFFEIILGNIIAA